MKHLMSEKYNIDNYPQNMMNHDVKLLFIGLLKEGYYFCQKFQFNFRPHK